MAKEFCKRGIEAIAVYSSVEDTFAGERAAGDHYRLEYSDDCIVYFDMRLIDLFKALAITDELSEITEHEAFKHQMQDILAYRTMEYYRRRYDLSLPRPFSNNLPANPDSAP